MINKKIVLCYNCLKFNECFDKGNKCAYCNSENIEIVKMVR